MSDPLLSAALHVVDALNALTPRSLAVIHRNGCTTIVAILGIGRSVRKIGEALFDSISRTRLVYLTRHPIKAHRHEMSCTQIVTSEVVGFCTCSRPHKCSRTLLVGFGRATDQVRVPVEMSDSPSTSSVKPTCSIFHRRRTWFDPMAAVSVKLISCPAES